MNAYRLTRLARGDIFDIWSYIAGDSEEIADRVEKAIHMHALSYPKHRKEVMFAAT